MVPTSALGLEISSEGPPAQALPGPWQPCWQDTAGEPAGSLLWPGHTPSWPPGPRPYGTGPSHWSHLAAEPERQKGYNGLG